MSVHFSSKSDNHPTPASIFDPLDAEFGFTLDPCASAENAKCENYYTVEDDGLAQDWQNEIVFCNPPYGRGITGKWVEKGYESAQQGATVVMLIPARTDTNYWHKYVMRASEIRLYRGRIKFGDGTGSAPFPSAIVVFRPPTEDGSDRPEWKGTRYIVGDTRPR